MKLCSRFNSFCRCLRKTSNLGIWTHFGKLGVTHDLGWWLVGKPMRDFLFALIELFIALCWGSRVMRRNMYSSAVFEGGRHLHWNFTWTRSSPSTILCTSKLETIGLPDVEDRISLRSLILMQYRSVTGKRTDLP